MTTMMMTMTMTMMTTKAIKTSSKKEQLLFFVIIFVGVGALCVVADLRVGKTKTAGMGLLGSRILRQGGQGLTNGQNHSPMAVGPCGLRFCLQGGWSFVQVLLRLGRRQTYPMFRRCAASCGGLSLGTSVHYPYITPWEFI